MKRSSTVEKIWLSHYEPSITDTFSYPESTLSDLLAESARKYPYHVATDFVLSYILGQRVAVGGSLTYGRLHQLVERFAAALYALGVRKGDRVALMLPNSPQFVIAFFATMRLGAIVVNHNPTYTPRELQHQLCDSGAETIILLNIFYPRLQEIQQHTPLKRVVVSNIYDTLAPPTRLLVWAKLHRGDDWVDVRPGPDLHLFQALLDAPHPAAPAPEITPDDTALFQYTGGTTGIPKAAMLSHRNLVANTYQIHAWLPSARPGEEKMMSAIPFFHVYGMTVAMLFGLSIGAALVIVPNPRPIDNVMTVIQKTRATIFPGVPAMYINIVNHSEIGSYDLSSVRACISGSAPLPMEVQERFGALTGGRLVEGYGLTEASPVTHCNPVFGQRKRGSIGVPLPGVEAKLVSLEDGSELAPGQGQGELAVRGPQVMQGYWGQPDETKVMIDEDGWLHTGDVCTVDEDGYFFIVDRKKDMIIASGFKILPREVEEVLYMHPKVEEAVVLGVPNPVRGDDTVKAYIVPRQGEQPTEDEIRSFCRQHLAPYKVPRAVEFRATLPKTMVGKVLKRVLLDEERAKQASPDPAGLVAVS
ncbi:long-chain fatty acid--CoA ligase [Chloroflexia bacterium SDU3-3]|nr:long-chain fatty acid--CoA ligase [Chloroflexia bacterium SDU3-3]